MYILEKYVQFNRKEVILKGKEGNKQLRIEQNKADKLLPYGAGL